MENHNNNLEIIQSYPLFKANQVLRESQLNDIVRYLEQQDRLSRICLMGTGIVCGLEAYWNKIEGHLYVSGGTGVTSEGYLIKAKSQKLTGDQKIDFPFDWFGLEEEEIRFESIPRIMDLGQASEEDENILDLKEEDLSDKVLVLVLDSRQDEDEGLCGNDCDEKGVSRTFITHYVLVEKNVADIILQATYDPQDNKLGNIFENLNELFYHKFSAIHPPVERFGFNNGAQKTIKLNDISTYEEFIRRYILILESLSARLDSVFLDVNKIFSPVFTPKLVTDEKPIEEGHLSSKISEALKNQLHQINIQYLHDYLCDLVHAYEELMDAVYDLVADCPPNTHRFPKYLWVKGFLGDDKDKAQFSIYRTPYTQPPVYNGNHSRLAEAKSLYERLVLMVKGDVFQIHEPSEKIGIKITPGRSDMSVLSQRAVPFYYKNLKELMDIWSPRLKRLGRAGKVYSYYRSASAPYDEPLMYRMEGCDFLRIEGHIGKQFHDVVRDLTDLRQHYNLPFEMVALKIGEEFDDELFQFVCADLACEKRKYQEQYERLREIVLRNVPDALQDVLPGNLDDFESDIFIERYEGHFQGNIPGHLPQPESFRQIDACYRDLKERWERAKKKHLFHHFALEHPGMKHRGGVPLGGTFILAYVDTNILNPERNTRINDIEAIFGPIGRAAREAILQDLIQSRTIVADFYLPYSCVSCCPPHSIIAERPRPVLLVSPSVFCEGDTNPTELEITVHPEGGVITGAGYKFEGGKHLFTPSETGISEGTVELKYYIDGGEATYLLTIVKRPEADFVLPERACQNDQPFSLDPQPEGGTFDYKVEDLDFENVIENGQFFPGRIEAEDVVVVTVIYSASVGPCTDTREKTIEIHPTPQVDFEATFIGLLENPNRDFENAIRFVNIQPEDAQKYIWNSNSNILTRILNEGHSEKIPGEPIVFDQDFEGKLWIELSAAGEICQSDPLRKHVLPVINTLTLFVSSEIIVGNDRNLIGFPLQDGTIINRTRIERQPFFIRATTLPQQIDRVAFELEFEGDSLAKTSSGMNDAGNGYDLSNDTGFESARGRYRLKATPILKTEEEQSELEGFAVEINFTIEENDSDDGGIIISSGRELSGEAITFLRRRDNSYRNEITELGTDSALARTTSFQKTEAFLHVQSESEDFEKQYFDLVDTLERAAKRAESGSTRQDGLFKLMEIATKYFMDRQVVKSPDEIPEETLQEMASRMESMEEIGFDRETLKNNWEGEALKNELNASSVEAFDKVLKPR